MLDVVPTKTKTLFSIVEWNACQYQFGFNPEKNIFHTKKFTEFEPSKNFNLMMKKDKKNSCYHQQRKLLHKENKRNVTSSRKYCLHITMLKNFCSRFLICIAGNLLLTWISHFLVGNK